MSLQPIILYSAVYRYYVDATFSYEMHFFSTFFSILAEDGRALMEPTFHLEDDLGAVLTLGGGHLTPVGAAVLEVGALQQQRGVALGHLLGEDGGAASQLTLLVFVFVLVIFFFLFFGVSAVTVVVAPLELEHDHVLSQPPDGFLVARREAAGQQTFLRHHTGHRQVWNNR